jgi:hypothetical protein
VDLTIVAEAPVHESEKGPSIRGGTSITQTLLGDEAEDGLKFRFVRYQEGMTDKPFKTPRHHHGFQQIRWSESGAVNYAPGQDIPEGDIAYFPRGAYYGPQLKDKGVQLLLQFGLGDEYVGGGKDWHSQYSRDMALMASRGRFVDGLYVDSDPDTGEERQRDAVQAIFEERSKKKVVIPEAGYEAPVLMHPRAYDYYQAAPGVELKHLGSFYDHPGPHADVRISMARLADGGRHSLGADRAHVIWSVGPGLQIGDRTYPELTCVYSPRGEELTVAGLDAVEIFIVEMPCPA